MFQTQLVAATANESTADSIDSTFPSNDQHYSQFEQGNDDTIANTYVNIQPRPSSSAPTLPQAEFNLTFYNPFETKHRRRTSRAQYQILEDAFQNNPKPNSAIRQALADQLSMTMRGVQIWFQNRRAKAKQQHQVMNTNVGNDTGACPNKRLTVSARSAKHRRSELYSCHRINPQPLITEWDSQEPLDVTSVIDPNPLLAHVTTIGSNPTGAQTSTCNIATVDNNEPATPQEPVLKGDAYTFEVDFVNGYDSVVYGQQIFHDWRSDTFQNVTSSVYVDMYDASTTSKLNFHPFGCADMCTWITDSTGTHSSCPVLTGPIDGTRLPDDYYDDVTGGIPSFEPLWRSAHHNVMQTQNQHHIRCHSDPEDYLYSPTLFGWYEAKPQFYSPQLQPEHHF